MTDNNNISNDQEISRQRWEQFAQETGADHQVAIPSLEGPDMITRQVEDQVRAIGGNLMIQQSSDPTPGNLPLDPWSPVLQAAQPAPLQHLAQADDAAQKGATNDRSPVSQLVVDDKDAIRETPNIVRSMQETQEGRRVLDRIREAQNEVLGPQAPVGTHTPASVGAYETQLALPPPPAAPAARDQ